MANSLSSELPFHSFSPALYLLLVLLLTIADSGAQMITFMNMPFFLQWGCTWDCDVTEPAVFFPSHPVLPCTSSQHTFITEPNLYKTGYNKHSQWLAVALVWLFPSILSSLTCHRMPRTHLLCYPLMLPLQHHRAFVRWHCWNKVL